MGELTLADLVVSEKKTELHQISIELLAKYYEQYLMPHTYRFELDNGVVIDLKFERKDFCHLIGIQQIATARYEADVRKNKQRKITPQMYSGTKGFKRARDKKIKFSDLKNLHISYYMQQEGYEKFNFFHFIDRMLASSSVSVASFVEVDNSNITCDFLFHDKFDGALLHLGVEKDEAKDGNVFFAKTFLRIYLTDDKWDRFITNGGGITIKNRTII